MVADYESIVTELLRPVIIVLMFQTLRANCAVIVLNLKDSIVTLSLIFVFVLYFAFFGNLLFTSTFEDYAVTSTLQSSYWQFLVLLTTENYPDVFLLAYMNSWFSLFFFWVFIVIGIFYLTSILLAIVFDNYKRRVEEISQRKLNQRLHYVNIFYD